MDRHLARQCPRGSTLPCCWPVARKFMDESWYRPISRVRPVGNQLSLIGAYHGFSASCYSTPSAAGSRSLRLADNLSSTPSFGLKTIQKTRRSLRVLSSKRRTTFVKQSEESATTAVGRSFARQQQLQAREFLRTWSRVHDDNNDIHGCSQELLSFLCNMTSVDFKLAFNIMTYDDSDNI